MHPPEPPASVTTSFVIGGDDFDPALFSQQIGLSPTKVWHRTLEVLQENLCIPRLEWRYQLDRRPHGSLDDAIQEILAFFFPRREQIVSFADKYNCTVSVICRVHGDSMAIELCVETRTIELLAGLRCAICFSFDG
jgi:hypothetical protein